MIVIRPTSWIKTESYDKDVDDWFVEALKNPVITDIRFCTCELNGKTIWTENRYYAGPTFYGNSLGESGLCTIDTARRFYKLLKKTISENNKKDKIKESLQIEPSEPWPRSGTKAPPRPTPRPRPPMPPPAAQVIHIPEVEIEKMPEKVDTEFTTIEFT